MPGARSRTAHEASGHGRCIVGGMAHPKQTTSEKVEQHFFEIMRKFDQAMLITQSETAGLRGRPMVIAETADDGSVWFISRADTQKMDEMAKDSEILAVMQSSSQWLSITGHAEIQKDRAHIHRLWKETYRAWCDGKDDPNIALIRLKPREAEYWDNSGLKGLKFALRYAAAYVTGKELRSDQDDPDNHAKLPL
jgi:general stress protein 26